MIWYKNTKPTQNQPTCVGKWFLAPLFLLCRSRIGTHAAFLCALMCSQFGSMVRAIPNAVSWYISTCKSDVRTQLMLLVLEICFALRLLFQCTFLRRSEGRGVFSGKQCKKWNEISLLMAWVWDQVPSYLDTMRWKYAWVCFVIKCSGEVFCLINILKSFTS